MNGILTEAQLLLSMVAAQPMLARDTDEQPRHRDSPSSRSVEVMLLDNRRLRIPSWHTTVRATLAAAVAGLALSVTAGHAAAQDVDSVSTGSTTGQTLTVAHTTSGSDRLMMVGISMRNDDHEYATSVTYKGVALTFVAADERSDDARVEVWQLVAPPVGTHNVVVTFNKDLKKAAVAGVTTFTGVDQTTPVGATATANGKSTQASVTITAAANELVWSVVDAKKPVTLTPGASQTEHWQRTTDGDEAFGAGSTQPGNGNVTASWTLGDDKEWAIAAVAVRSNQPPPPPPTEYVDAVSTGATQGQTLTISHTTSGSSRLMLVGVSINNDNFETVTSVTYAGSSLTLVATRTEEDDARVEVWQLVAPPTGTHNVVVTFSAAPFRGAVAGVTTFTGIDQTNPIAAIQTAEGTSNAGSVSVPSASDEIVFGAIASELPGTLTPGWGQLETWNLSTNGGFAHGAGSISAGSSSVPVSWSLGSADDWAIVGLSIRLQACTGSVVTTAAVGSSLHLPSNGVTYSTTFTVTNTGSAEDDFDLLSTHSGSAISLMSITGQSVVQGATPDSALLQALGIGDSTVVTVSYTVDDVPASTPDTLALSARSRCNPASSDLARTAMSVVRPRMNTTKTVEPAGDPQADPLPGTELSYTLTTTNDGSEEAYNVVVVDSVAAEVHFKVGSTTAQLPAGINALIEYSNDAGSSWTYTPVSEGCGAPSNYDACVTHIRWTLQSPLSQVAPDNTIQLNFIARIE